MSAIPNRYYNSPWIAEAGANLASALAPPDPDKMLARQRADWAFQQAQIAAQQAEEDRAAGLAGDDAIARLFADAGQQPKEPHSPGEATWFSQHPEAAGPVGMDDATFLENVKTAIHGKRALSDVVTASGPRGAAWNARLGFLNEKDLDAYGLQRLKGTQSYDRTALGVSGSFDRAMLLDARERALAADEEKVKILLKKMEGDQQVAHDATVGANKPPIDITPSDARANVENTQDWYSAMTGRNLDNTLSNMPADVMQSLTDYTDWLYQQSRNSTTASDDAREFFFGKQPKVTKAHDAWALLPWDHQVEEPSIALRDGKTLGQLQMEIEKIKSDYAAAHAAPQAQVPSAGAGAGPSQVSRVPVNSIPEARLLPGNTPFIVVGPGPDYGRTGTTPPAPVQ